MYHFSHENIIITNKMDLFLNIIQPNPCSLFLFCLRIDFCIRFRAQYTDCAKFLSLEQLVLHPLWVFPCLLLEDLDHLFCRIPLLGLVDCIVMILLNTFFYAIFYIFYKLVVRPRGLIGFRFSFSFGKNTLWLCSPGSWKRVVAGWLRSSWRVRPLRTPWFRWKSLRVSWEVLVLEAFACSGYWGPS